MSGQGSKYREISTVMRRYLNPQRVDGGRGISKLVKVFECISTGGQRLSGFYIYFGEAFTFGSSTRTLHLDIGYDHTENRWANRDISYKWVAEHFPVYAPPSALDSSLSGSLL